MRWLGAARLRLRCSRHRRLPLPSVGRRLGAARLQWRGDCRQGAAGGGLRLRWKWRLGVWKSRLDTQDFILGKKMSGQTVPIPSVDRLLWRLPAGGRLRLRYSRLPGVWKC